jgi:hypothetical protein
LITTGASDLRTVFTPEEIPGVLLAYMHGLKSAFAVSVAFCGLAFISTFFIPWGKLKTHSGDSAEVDSPKSTSSETVGAD